MAMAQNYLDAIANHGGTLITHIGLVNGSEAEPTGGDPAYARKAVTWTTASGDGMIRPTGNLVFDVSAGFSVRGWRGYTALTGGTNRGGAALTQEDYAGQGTYTLLAASTAVDHNAA
jgi:hypothetical protein